MASARFRLERSVSVALGIAAALLFVADAIAACRSPKLSTASALGYVADAVVWTPWSLIGVLIAARGVRTRGTTALAFAMVSFGLNFAIADADVLNGMQHTQPWRMVLALTGLIAARAFLHCCQLFPRPLTRQDVLSSRAASSGIEWFQKVLAALLAPWTTWVVAAVYVAAKFLLLGLLADIPLILLGLAFVRVFVRVGNPIVRRRVTWIIQASLFVLAMFAVSFALQSLMESAGVGVEARNWVYLAYCVPLGIGASASMAMAVFGAGVVNPSLVLRSTVVYGAVISFLLFALNVIMSVLVDSATHLFGLNDRFVAATLGALAGLLLEPLAKALKRLVGKVDGPLPKRA